jgi:hypothetical protein
MGGVLLPGRDLSATNPAWHGADLPRRSRPIPIPLGLVAGLAADTEDQDDFEATVTRLKAAYPFFEVELRPEPDISDDILIDVAEDYLRIDLGKGTASIPDGDVETDFLVTNGIFSIRPGPVYVELSTVLVSDGRLRLDDSLRAALKGTEPFDSGTTYEADGVFEGQGALALEVGTAVKLLPRSPDEAGAWTLFGAAGIKGLMGLGYADTRLNADMVTGDPIFDVDDPLDVTYVADLRFNEGVGWGAGLDLGVAAIRGPWALGLGVENVVAHIWWDTELRREELDADGESISTTLETGARVRSTVPAVAVANAAWSEAPWVVAGDVRVQQGKAAVHGGVERRLGLFAVRSGLSWGTGKGIQGAVGAGIGGERWSFDVSLRTHPYLYSDGRGVFLGASIGVPL